MKLVNIDDFFKHRINSFSRLDINWNSHGAGPINQITIDRALKLLDVLISFHYTPDDIVPTAENTIMFKYYSENPKLCLIEIDEKEMAFLSDDLDTKSNAWLFGFDDIEELCNNIKGKIWKD